MFISKVLLYFPSAYLKNCYKNKITKQFLKFYENRIWAQFKNIEITCIGGHIMRLETYINIFL